jgi:hypothetical protein
VRRAHQLCAQKRAQNGAKLPNFLGQRVRESNPISEIRDVAQFRRKLAAISALTVLIGNGDFAGFAQTNAVQVSNFVRKV